MPRLLCCLLCWAFASWVHAQNYPVKPIRMIVPFAAGGGTDLVTRLFGQKLSDAFAEPSGSTPAEFSAYIHAEIPKLSKIIRDTGIRAE